MLVTLIYQQNNYKPLSTLLSVVWICSMYCTQKCANSFLTIFGRPHDKIKFSLCTPRRNIEGEEEEEEVYLHSFLTSELDKVGWPTSHTCRYILGCRNGIWVSVVMWFPEPVWTFWRRECLAPPGTEQRIIHPLVWSQQYIASCDVDINVTHLYKNCILLSGLSILLHVSLSWGKSLEAWLSLYPSEFYFISFANLSPSLVCY